MKAFLRFLPLSFFASIIVSFACVGCGKTESAATANPPSNTGDPVKVAAAQASAPVRQTSFHAVTSKLDAGGSLYGYVSVDQWLKGLSVKVGEFKQLFENIAGTNTSDLQDIGRGFDLVQRLIKTSGLESLDGVGMSGLEVAPGLFRTKFVLHHPEGEGDGYLWSLFGKESHALEGVNLLPNQTALAAFGDLNLTELWTVLQRELVASKSPQAAEAAKAWPETFKKQSGLDWDQLLGSLAGQLGVVITLDPVKMVQFPVGPNTLDVPQPGLMVAVKVNNDLIYDRVIKDLKNNASVVITNEAGLKMASMPLPVPLPIPLELVVASTGDYLFLATAKALVRDAIGVRAGKIKGVKDSREFNHLAAHLELKGNQFSYTDRRLAEVVQNIQKQVMASGVMGSQEVTMIQNLFLNNEPTYALGVSARTATGWDTVSVGNQDSSTVVLALPAVALIGVTGGLALPALAKAKGKAQTINCVSNLKQLGLAARIYANDHEDIMPPAATWADAMKNEISNPKILRDPSADTSERCHYAYNAKLAGLKHEEINSQTVMFFETEGGWNQHGGKELLLKKPRHPGLYIIGYADGSVQQVRVSKIGDLRWDP